MKKLLLYMICLSNTAIYAEFEKVSAENIASMPPQKVRNAFANTADYKDIEFTNLQAVEFKIKQATKLGTKAATTLQNAARTYQKKQALKEKAATDIQRVFKGIKARKETGRMRNERDKKAANFGYESPDANPDEWGIFSNSEATSTGGQDQPTTPEAAKGDEIEKLIKQLKELRGKQRKSQGSAKKQIDTTINDLRETILKINPNFKEEAPKSKAKKGKRNN